MVALVAVEAWATGMNVPEVHGTNNRHPMFVTITYTCVLTNVNESNSVCNYKRDTNVLRKLQLRMILVS